MDGVCGAKISAKMDYCAKNGDAGAENATIKPLGGMCQYRVQMSWYIQL